MNTYQQKHIGEAPLSRGPEKPLNFRIGDKKVKERHLDDKAVTARTIGDDVIPTLVRPITDGLQQQIDSFNDHGMSVSNEFGSNSHIGVSQKTLTEAFNKLWQKLAEITGEPTTGIALTVTPDYFISDDECTVHISAEHETHVFEKITFYADDELLAEAENVREYSCDSTINKTCTIKCVATILGMEYTEIKKVTKYFPFFIGCGTSWEDMISEKYAREYKGTIHGNYDIEVENTGDRIYIITPASLEDEFNGAFMNGFEIPFSIVNNTQYIIRESRNTYTKGIYNIDIN